MAVGTINRAMQVHLSKKQEEKNSFGHTYVVSKISVSFFGKRAPLANFANLLAIRHVPVRCLDMHMRTNL